jgi:hypothetical protein
MERYESAAKEAERAKKSLAETMRHNEFLQGRVNELEAITKSDSTAHYDQELRRVREHLGTEIARLTADLKQERSSRKSLENDLRELTQNGAQSIHASESNTESEGKQANLRLKASVVENISPIRAFDKSSLRASDDWSNALGLGTDDDEGMQPVSEPSPMRDALLDAARHELLKLGEMNRKLLQAKLAAEKESVSKSEHEAVLERNNQAWALKAAQLNLEASKLKENMARLESQIALLTQERETRELELEDLRSKSNPKPSSNSDSADRTDYQGSWIKHLPRSPSSPDACTEKDNFLACLGSWASLNGLDDSDDDICRMEDDVKEEIKQEPAELGTYTSRRHILEEKSRKLRAHLGGRTSKPPLSPLQASQEAMDRSICQGRLAMEAMRASRSSLLRSSASLSRSESSSRWTDKNV